MRHYDINDIFIKTWRLDWFPGPARNFYMNLTYRIEYLNA